MKFIDSRMSKLVAIVAINGGRMDAEDPAIQEFSDDRWDDSGVERDDTFNLCFAGGLISQVQVDDDSFVIELGP